MNNTIFDDVFRTMIEKMPYLAVPLINEVFHTSYPEDVKITQLRNEHQQEDGEIITDSCLLIGKKMYHIECQSTDDMTMVIRMIEYDFAIGIEHAEKQGRRYRIEFPKSCVLFLRSSGNTPDYLEADVVFPDGNTYLYSIPAIKMADYTKDSIFEKNLLMLLPFYIMRYEKKGHDFNNNPELFQVLLNEYEEIRISLEKELTETGKSELYTDLTKLIVKIADYIFQKEEQLTAISLIYTIQNCVRLVQYIYHILNIFIIQWYIIAIVLLVFSIMVRTDMIQVRRIENKVHIFLER